MPGAAGSQESASLQGVEVSAQIADLLPEPH